MCPDYSTNTKRSNQFTTIKVTNIPTAVITEATIAMLPAHTLCIPSPRIEDLKKKKPKNTWNKQFGNFREKRWC